MAAKAVVVAAGTANILLIDRIESRVSDGCPVVKHIYVELESLTRGSGRPGAGARSG